MKIFSAKELGINETDDKKPVYGYPLLKNLEFELKQITVFCGESGTGKTTALETIKAHNDVYWVEDFFCSGYENTDPSVPEDEQTMLDRVYNKWSQEDFYVVPDDASRQFKAMSLREAVALWGKELNIGCVELREQKYAKNSTNRYVYFNVDENHIFCEGKGTQNLISTVVQGLAAPHNKILIFENPETNLSNSQQLKLADFLIAVASNRQIIIETQSEHIVNRLVRRALEDKSVLDNLCFQYFTKVDGCAKVEEVKVDDCLGFGETPEGFFDQMASETEAILKAGYANMRKKQDNKSYEFWRENVMDERLSYLSAEEKYEMYLNWKE